MPSQSIDPACDRSTKQSRSRLLVLALLTFVLPGGLCLWASDEPPRTSKFVSKLPDGWTFKTRVPGLFRVGTGEHDPQTKFIMLTPEQAAHVAAELAIMGREQYLTQVVTEAKLNGQLRETGVGEYRLNVRIARPATRSNWVRFQEDFNVEAPDPLPSSVSVSIPGTPRFGFLERDRYLLFTREQADVLASRLKEVGFSIPEIAMALVGFRAPENPTRPSTDKLTTPPCDECSIGDDCDPTSFECCAGNVGSCVLCNFCSSELQIGVFFGPDSPYER